MRKSAARLEAFGELDHVNSWCGLAEAVLAKSDGTQDLREDLRVIQQFLFDCTTDLSIPKGHREYKIGPDHIAWLERKIDQYSDEAPEILYFIIPGGSEAAGWLHVLRTTARNAERKIVTFLDAEPDEVNPHVLKFVNRLSDYFFVIARVANVRLGVADVPYERSERVFHVSKEKRQELKKEQESEG